MRSKTLGWVVVGACVIFVMASLTYADPRALGGIGLAVVAMSLYLRGR